MGGVVAHYLCAARKKRQVRECEDVWHRCVWCRDVWQGPDQTDNPERQNKSETVGLDNQTPPVCTVCHDTGRHCQKQPRGSPGEGDKPDQKWIKRQQCRAPGERNTCNPVSQICRTGCTDELQVISVLNKCGRRSMALFSSIGVKWLSSKPTFARRAAFVNMGSLRTSDAARHLASPLTTHAHGRQIGRAHV